MISPEKAQELIELVQETNIAEVFEKLSDEGINTQELNHLKREFVHGNYPYTFYERLQTFINQIAHTEIEVKLPRFDIFLVLLI